MAGVRHNYAYFPVFIDAEKFGMSRDDLYDRMRKHGILSRRYFYPLISNFPSYCNLPSSKKELLPIANEIADEVLCLPIHHELTKDDLKSVLTCFNK